MPVTRIPVDVFLERVPLANRWASERWQPAAVVPVGPPSEGGHEPTPGPPEAVHEGAEGTQWRFPGHALDIHPSEAQGYYLNLSAPQPRVFVMWRMFEGETPPARPVVVTVSYDEAARMMDGGEQVDSVAMPMPVLAWLSAYAAEHYKPEPRRKVRRNDPFGAGEGGRDPVYDAGKIRRS